VIGFEAKLLAELGGGAFGATAASSAAEPPAARLRGETPRTPQRLRRAPRRAASSAGSSALGFEAEVLR
jgi:hypothetical protein